MPRKTQTNRRIFWSLAFFATVMFLASGDAGSGSRSLKNFWEGRDKSAISALADRTEAKFTLCWDPGEISPVAAA